MGPEDRGEVPPLGPPRLWEQPFRFEFIQAVRLLHELAHSRNPVGHDVAPNQEVVRFSVHRDLGFPASQIHDLSTAPSAPLGPPTMTVAFIGLTGPSGVLPTHYSELVVEEAGPEGRAGPLADFLDMFHHRLISFFYRAWERNHPHLSPDPEKRASFYRYLLALLGEAIAPPKGTHFAESLSFLKHAELWAQKRRTSEGLRILLLDRLNDSDGPLHDPHHRIAVEIVPFAPRWIDLDPNQVLRLGAGGATGTSRLGAPVGRRARDYQGRFRVCIGPLTLSQFRRLEPRPRRRKAAVTRSTYQDILDLIRHYVGPELDFEMSLILKANEVPRARLDRGAQEPRLGRSWMITREPDRNVETRFPATLAWGK
jgi:type VI secretion system protein ImpH